MFHSSHERSLYCHVDNVTAVFTRNNHNLALHYSSLLAKITQYRTIVTIPYSLDISVTGEEYPVYGIRPGVHSDAHQVVHRVAGGQLRALH